MFKPRFNPKVITDALRKEYEKKVKVIVAEMQRTGADFIKEAKDNGEYKDQTGNLRSSIGYFVFNGSQVEASGFAGNKSVGRSEALMLAREYAEPGMIKLVLVAGMEYASYVEARGYNVASNQALTIIPVLGRNLKQRFK